ncbi:MAG: hypothetical protein HXX16_17970 [Bacteroidales bacterium]|nr:hypothetical protein [Bacteroidales bacterium]
MSIFRWLYELIFLYVIDKKIPIIWVESPRLTSSYYKEYLGFRILTWKNNQKGMDILLKKQNNLIWIKQLDKSLVTKQIQKITIFLSNIESEYSNLSQRVRLVKPIDKLNNKNTFFTVRDCNGIDIVCVRPRI